MDREPLYDNKNCNYYTSMPATLHITNPHCFKRSSEAVASYTPARINCANPTLPCFGDTTKTRMHIGTRLQRAVHAFGMKDQAGPFPFFLPHEEWMPQSGS